MNLAAANSFLPIHSFPRWMLVGCPATNAPQPPDPLAAAASCAACLQDKKRAEEERQRELASLFAQSIKQPKVPAGEPAVGGSSTSTSSGSGWQRRPASQPPSSATHNAQGTEPDSRWHAPCPALRPAWGRCSHWLHNIHGLDLALGPLSSPPLPIAQASNPRPCCASSSAPDCQPACPLLACLPTAGVDPKTVLCEFFRHGQCTKGFKCKFSHDLAVERKTQKADLFTDRCGRAGGEAGQAGSEGGRAGRQGESEGRKGGSALCVQLHVQLPRLHSAAQQLGGQRLARRVLTAALATAPAALPAPAALSLPAGVMRVRVTKAWRSGTRRRWRRPSHVS
jgi:hypothetical protein